MLLLIYGIRIETIGISIFNAYEYPSKDIPYIWVFLLNKLQQEKVLYILEGKSMLCGYVDRVQLYGVSYFVIDNELRSFAADKRHII